MRAAIREIIETIILSLLLFIGIQFAVQTYQVEGASMYPTLAQGQYLLVNKVIYRHLSVGETVDISAHKGGESQGSRIFPFQPPQHGEVVVFNAPDDPTRDFVKRVMGVPGDTVEIRNGRTYVNGKRLQEDYAELDDFDEMEEFIVPANSYFVMGDNRRQSNDSRDWGPVPLEHIVGRAWVRYWPPHEIRVFPTEKVFSASASAVTGRQR